MHAILLFVSVVTLLFRFESPLVYLAGLFTSPLLSLHLVIPEVGGSVHFLVGASGWEYEGSVLSKARKLRNITSFCFASQHSAHVLE